MYGSGNPDRNIPGFKKGQGNKLGINRAAGSSKVQKRKKSGSDKGSSTKKLKKSTDLVDGTGEPAPMTMAQQKALARKKGKEKAQK